MATTSGVGGGEWEIDNDDGFVYKRPRDLHQTGHEDAPSTPAPALASESVRLQRRRRTILRLRAKYLLELSHWDSLSSDLLSPLLPPPAAPSRAPSASPCPCLDTVHSSWIKLCLSKSGTLQKNQILASLKGAGLPANEDNAAAMLRYLNTDFEGSISYSHFRSFMLLLPLERLEDDPRNIWFEAATLVFVPPPGEISAGNVLKSALAGGLASALSTSMLHPIDTMKTRVQASTLSFPELISKLPEIGLQGLYRGSIPAIIGQFSSHGLRTGIFEASKLILVRVAPTLPEIQAVIEEGALF